MRRSISDNRWQHTVEMTMGIYCILKTVAGFTTETMLYQLKSHKHLLHVHDQRNNSRSINALIFTLINWTIRFSSLNYFSRTPNLGSSWKCQNFPQYQYEQLFDFVSFKTGNKTESPCIPCCETPIYTPYNSAVRSLTEWHGPGNVYDKNLNESHEKVSKNHHKLIN